MRRMTEGIGEVRHIEDEKVFVLQGIEHFVGAGLQPFGDIIRRLLLRPRIVISKRYPLQGSKLLDEPNLIAG